MARGYNLTGTSSGTGGGGGGGGELVKYSQTFNATTDWSGPSAGYYNLTILAATHGMGTTPAVLVFELDGGDYVQVEVSVEADTSGNITLSVTEDGDDRFAGKVIIF